MSGAQGTALARGDAGVVRRPAGVRLAGTGMALPAGVLTNEELSRRVDTNDEWITQRTGIRQRYVCDEKTGAIELSRRAAAQALANAGIDAASLDLLICATLTPEMLCPSTGARVAFEIGAAPAGAFDVSAACSGFVYGLNMATGLIQTGFYRTAAVIGVETLSKVTDWNDRRTCVLFGDGAGAAILTADDDPRRGCLYQSMSSNGGLWKELYLPQKQDQVPPDAAFSGTLNTLQMNGREVYKFAVSTMQKAVEDALAATGIAASDLAMIIPHQSNARILESAREKLGLPEDKLYINIDRYGNTSAASVPICLHELMEAGRLKAGDLVLFVALGGGMTWATSLWRL